MMIRLTILGPPVGKARPRVTKWGTFTPEKTVNYETQIKERFASEYPDHKPFDGPLEMNVIAYFVIPKSTSKRNLSLMMLGGIRPTKKPDIDNIIKIIGDALNNIAYRDDSQIVRSECAKYYSDIPRVEIFIKECDCHGESD